MTRRFNSKNYDEYEEESHKNCPECGIAPACSTYVLYLIDKKCPDMHKDLNVVKCECGWEGVVHDLIGDKK